MCEDIISVERLIPMLGCSRSDPRVTELIDALDSDVTFSIDKEDGADDEYMEVKTRGLSLYFDAGRLASIFLYTKQKDPSYCDYALPLPSGLSFGQSKSAVLQNLGSSFSTGGGKKGFFGEIPEWVKYEREEYALHLEFGNGTSCVQMVTLMCV
jgi:hypothetical protein